MAARHSATSLEKVIEILASNPGSRLLGLDVGSALVGVSVSDADCRIACPLAIVSRNRPMPSNPLKGPMISNNQNKRMVPDANEIPSRDLRGIKGHERRKILKRPIFVQELDEIARKYSAAGLIVGYPLELSGMVSPQCRYVDSFLTQDVKAVPYLRRLPYVLWDERRSSVAARGLLRGLDIDPFFKKQLTDKISAVYILQGCLDALARRQ